MTAKSAGQPHPPPFIRGKINLSLMCFGFQSKSGHGEFCSWCWPWNRTRGCLWAHLAAGPEQLQGLWEQKCWLQPPPSYCTFICLTLLSKRSFCSGMYPNRIQIRGLKPHHGRFGGNSVWGDFTLTSPLPQAPIADIPLNILQAVFISPVTRAPCCWVGRRVVATQVMGFFFKEYHSEVMR